MRLAITNAIARNMAKRFSILERSSPCPMAHSGNIHRLLLLRFLHSIALCLAFYVTTKVVGNKDTKE
jgi:hypothetical protein